MWHPLENVGHKTHHQGDGSKSVQRQALTERHTVKHVLQIRQCVFHRKAPFGSSFVSVEHAGPRSQIRASFVSRWSPRVCMKLAMGSDLSHMGNTDSVQHTYPYNRHTTIFGHE